MAIFGYTPGDRITFGRKLDELVFASRPIDRPEHLLGREKELERIEKALCASGRNVFIYGERGVGKSSLAATAAVQYQSADASYIDVGCGPDDDFATLIANIAYQAAKVSRLKTVTKTVTGGAKWRYFSLEAGRSESIRNLHEEIRGVSDAIEVLREVCELHSERPVVVLDEFDRIRSEKERNLFADLLKQLGDKRVPIKLIITGVGASLEKLLGAHQSAIRQLETIELPRLGWEARWDIVINVLRAFGIRIHRDIYTRIAAISDGYPYYVHLMTEKLLWRIFDDPETILEVTKEHYRDALTDAIHSVNAELKRPYEQAINQRCDDYEEVLWSTADTEYLHRYIADMYTSYCYVVRQITGKTTLDAQKYRDRIRNLKKASCGSILVSEGNKGLYTYREKMLRGFVRMQAEANGIELIGEAQPTEKQYMHVPAKASSGYRQSTVPPGVHFGRKR